jgi:hypothetical protein
MKKRELSVFFFSVKQLTASDQYTCQCCAQFSGCNTDNVYGAAVEKMIELFQTEISDILWTSILVLREKVYLKQMMA